VSSSSENQNEEHAVGVVDYLFAAVAVAVVEHDRERKITIALKL
jgi:hypothetical protein